MLCRSYTMCRFNNLSLLNSTHLFLCTCSTCLLILQLCHCSQQCQWLSGRDLSPILAWFEPNSVMCQYNGNIELSNLKWVGGKNEVGNVMIVMIHISYSTDVNLMLDMCWSMFHLWLISNCVLLYPYIISVSTSYNSRGFLIFSLLFSQGLLIYSL